MPHFKAFWQLAVVLQLVVHDNVHMGVQTFCKFCVHIAVSTKSEFCKFYLSVDITQETATLKKEIQTKQPTNWETERLDHREISLQNNGNVRGINPLAYLNIKHSR